MSSILKILLKPHFWIQITSFQLAVLSPALESPSRASSFISKIFSVFHESSEPSPTSTSNVNPSGDDPYRAFRYQTQGRIVAIGDLHGDASAMRKALRLAQAIDENDQWIGKDLVIVQTGDQIDRWHNDREILDFMAHLAPQAEAAGGRVISLLGNHELLNVESDFRYVTPKSFLEFGNFPVPSNYELPKNLQLSAGDSYGIPGIVVFPTQSGVINRTYAFSPGHEYARLLSARSLFAIVNDTVFVHGGISPENVKYGLTKMNQEVMEWIQGDRKEIPEAVGGNDSPVWNRTYSDSTPKLMDCLTFRAQVLPMLGVKRMVVGHTIQERINPVCKDTIWRIDVALSRGYRNSILDPSKIPPFEILEIQGNRIRPIRASLISPRKSLRGTKNKQQQSQLE